MRRSRGLLAILAMLATLLTACSQAAPAQQAAPAGGGQKAAAPAASKEPIKIGVVADVSGVLVGVGQPVRTGIQMYVDKVNKEGGVFGRQIQLSVVDDKSDPSQATTGAKKLIDSDKVVGIIGSAGSSPTVALAKLAKDTQVPVVVPNAQATEIVAADNPFVFRILSNNDMDAARVISYIQQKGYKKVGLLYDTSALGLSGKAVVEPSLKKLGIELVAAEAHPQSAPDLTAQALKLKAAGPDALILWDLAADAANFAKTVTNMGWKVPILGSRGITIPVFGKTAGAVGAGVIATSDFDFGRSDSADFAKQYEAVAKTKDGTEFGACGWTAAQVLIEALKKAGEANVNDPKKVRDALEGLNGVPVLIGSQGAAVSFAAGKHEGFNPKDVVLLQFDGKDWQMLK